MTGLRLRPRVPDGVDSHVGSPRPGEKPRRGKAIVIVVKGQSRKQPARIMVIQICMFSYHSSRAQSSKPSCSSYSLFQSSMPPKCL
jgi:hypothetical protein